MAPHEPLQPLRVDTSWGKTWCHQGGIQRYTLAGVIARGADDKIYLINLTYFSYWWPPLAKASPVVERLRGAVDGSSGGYPTGYLEVGQHIRRYEGADGSHPAKAVNLMFLVILRN